MRTESKVVVEHPQPRALVRNSQRSILWGQTSAVRTGSKRLLTGTHADDWPKSVSVPEVLVASKYLTSMWKEHVSSHRAGHEGTDYMEC